MVPGHEDEAGNCGQTQRRVASPSRFPCRDSGWSLSMKISPGDRGRLRMRRKDAASASSVYAQGLVGVAGDVPRSGEAVRPRTENVVPRVCPCGDFCWSSAMRMRSVDRARMSSRAPRVFTHRVSWSSLQARVVGHATAVGKKMAAAPCTLPCRGKRVLPPATKKGPTSKDRQEEEASAPHTLRYGGTELVTGQREEAERPRTARRREDRRAPRVLVQGGRKKKMAHLPLGRFSWADATRPSSTAGHKI